MWFDYAVLAVKIYQIQSKSVVEGSKKGLIMLRIDVRDDLATLEKLLRGQEFLKSILAKLNTFSLYFFLWLLIA